MTRKIISISGFKGSGKDTFARLLYEQAPFEVTSFAQPLKHSMCEIFGWDPEQLEGLTPESRAWREQPEPYWSHVFGKTVTPRNLMTMMGTDCLRRHLHSDIWVHSCQKRILDSQSNVIITDARFINELQMVRDLGGITVRVHRPPLPVWYSSAQSLNKWPPFMRPYVKRWYSDLTPVHESETDWLSWKFDHVINNDADLNHLHAQAQQFVTPLFHQ